ncbi:MAG: DUF6607 family protein [Hyphomicrobium sp.]
MKRFVVFAMLVGLGATPAVGEGGPPEADRRAILAMAGDFDVTFDFRETLSLRSGYELAPPKAAKGREIVRVIEDEGGDITLQHMLVVAHDGKATTVKHWRQDWRWQPTSLLKYAARGAWRVRNVPAGEGKGRWSQTVWQTDDSPRYGALGAWRHDGGAATWTSDRTRRPLPRRDATRNPPYAWYDAVNRHIITPNGWAHEQENEKRGDQGGEPIAFAREYGLNTYTRAKIDDASAADSYWSTTKDYWREVRGFWDAAASDGEIRVAEEADRGSVIAAALMDLADDVTTAKITSADAAAKAKDLIAAEVGRQGVGGQ